MIRTFRNRLKDPLVLLANSALKEYIFSSSETAPHTNDERLFFLSFSTFLFPTHLFFHRQIKNDLNKLDWKSLLLEL